MIVVEPFDLVSGEQFLCNRPGVDGTKCDGLKIEESAEFFGLFVFLRHNQVLDADTILIGAVYPRFVGSDHSRQELGGVFFQADVLGPFVDVEEMADAVSGSVPVSELIVPQRFPGKYVELRSACPFGKDSCGKGNMSLQHQGIIFFHLPAQLTDSHRAGDIGSPVFVLRAGVDQQ